MEERPRGGREALSVRGTVPHLLCQSLLLVSRPQQHHYLLSRGGLIRVFFLMDIFFFFLFSVFSVFSFFSFFFCFLFFLFRFRDYYYDYDESVLSCLVWFCVFFKDYSS